MALPFWEFPMYQIMLHSTFLDTNIIIHNPTFSVFGLPFYKVCFWKVSSMERITKNRQFRIQYLPVYWILTQPTKMLWKPCLMLRGFATYFPLFFLGVVSYRDLVLWTQESPLFSSALQQIFSIQDIGE
jgi:hypothetical protein